MAWKHVCYNCQYEWDAKTREGLCPNCNSITVIANNLNNSEENKIEETKTNKNGPGD